MCGGMQPAVGAVVMRKATFSVDSVRRAECVGVVLQESLVDRAQLTSRLCPAEQPDEVRLVNDQFHVLCLMVDRPLEEVEEVVDVREAVPLRQLRETWSAGGEEARGQARVGPDFERAGVQVLDHVLHSVRLHHGLPLAPAEQEKLDGGRLVVFLVKLRDHAAEPEHQVHGRLLLNVVVAQPHPVFELHARKDDALVVGRYAFLVLDLFLHLLNRRRRLGRPA